MSVAIPQSRPQSSLATRPNMLPKSSNTHSRIQVQPRPSSSSSSSNQRPVMSKPSGPQIASRPPPSNVQSHTHSNFRGSSDSTSSSSSKLVSKGNLAMTPPSIPSPRPTIISRNSSVASTPVAIPIPSSSTTSNSQMNAPSSISGKDTSSSAGKIFAKPSKEWVLPERAKPGRKVSIEEPDNKRQSQNRLSQRAHRARRTDYIQTLEERLRQYEANEIHSNVRLQEVARALKADNERLKNELDIMNKQSTDFNSERELWDLEKKNYKDLLNGLKNEIDLLKKQGSTRSIESTIVRMEVDQDTIDSLVPGLSPITSRSRRPTLTSTTSFSIPSRQRNSISYPVAPTDIQVPQKRDLVDCPICPNPDPDCPCQQGPSSASTSTSIMHTNQAIRRDITLVQPSTCGLCHSTDECLCRVVVDREEEEDVKPIISSSSPRISSPTKSFKALDDGCGLCAGGGFCACRAASDTPSNNSNSSGINKAVSASSTTPTVVRVTSSAAAMPLRLKSKSYTTGKQSIWTLNNVTTTTVNISPNAEAVCTGDPDNCDACKNDSFGREFCQHLFEDSHPDAVEGTEGSTKPKGCGNCSGPGGCMSIKSLISPTPQEVVSSSSVPLKSNKMNTPSYQHDQYDDEPQEHLGLAPIQMTCCGNPELCGGHHGASTSCTGEIVLNGLSSSFGDHEDEGNVSEQQSSLTSNLKSNLEMNRPMVHMHTEYHPDDYRNHEDDDDHTKLRPDQAWKQLKAHPNAKFASLALLADVVARRTNVLGSMNSPSPAPSSPLSSTHHNLNPNPTSPTTTISHKPMSTSSNTTTSGMGRKRGFDIETSAVREALKILDKATPVGSPAPEGGDERQGKRRRV
ncbi:uncharacterized protein IL334_004834 [Kwoniella shivajii]|uniref:BZIP domain-containing protein n=1 Tax=Kwoniella shivajii TaxID=564305 RepID=A0ABZ1D1T8_9TREE|nr:hypothetical protein IL334_004834 [Kwoniella shivajii]